MLFHPNKEYLRECLAQMHELIRDELKLEFNEKTQILPIKNGVSYLGWHLYLTDTGKVIRKLKTQSKKRAKRRIRKLQKDYADDARDWEYVSQVLTSYDGWMRHGDTWRLRNKMIYNVGFTKATGPLNTDRKERQ